MNKVDLAWAAGLIDGEGCISLVRHPAAHFDRAVSTRYHLILKVTMCCKKTVDRLHALFQIGSRSERAPKIGEKVSTSYTWICNARQAEKVLKQLHPYLFTKIDEAVVALEFLALPLAPRGGSRGSARIPPKLQAQRESCFERLRALKTRSKFKGKRVGRKQSRFFQGEGAVS